MRRKYLREQSHCVLVKARSQERDGEEEGGGRRGEGRKGAQDWSPRDWVLDKEEAAHGNLLACLSIPWSLPFLLSLLPTFLQ